MGAEFYVKINKTFSLVCVYIHTQKHMSDAFCFDRTKRIDSHGRESSRTH